MDVVSTSSLAVNDAFFAGIKFHIAHGTVAFDDFPLPVSVEVFW
jgi:hypothetical protein